MIEFNTIKRILQTSLLALLLCAGTKTFALTWNSNVSPFGNWGTAASWTTNPGVPNLGSNANNTANILSGDSIIAGNLTLGVNGNIFVKSGGVLYITGEFRFANQGRITVETGGKLIVDGLVKGTPGNTYTGDNSRITVEDGATAIFNSTVRPGSGNIVQFDGDVTINGNINPTGAGSTLNIGSTGDVTVTGTANFNTNGKGFIDGALTTGNLISNGGGSHVTVNGTGSVDVTGTMTISNNGAVKGTGIVQWGSASVNSGNSGAFLGCNGGAGKYDNNGATGFPIWPANPIDLLACGPVCSTLDSGEIAAAQTICNGADVAAFTSVSPASGGDGSTYDYQWQSSTTSGTAGFTDIATETSATYDHGVLATTTWFRREVTSSICGTKYTAALEVTVHDVLAAGTIGTAQNVRHSTAPDQLTDVAPATGGGGSTYQWQDSTLGGTWANIGAATAASYSPPALTNDTWYRRTAISTSGCGTVYSAGLKMTIEVILSCGEAPPNVTEIVAPSGGAGGPYTYQWERSTTGPSAGFTIIGGETDPTLSSPPAPTQTTWYRRAVYDNGCGPLYTPAVQAQVSQGPGDVPGDLLVWLKPENASAGTWTDASGNNHDYSGVGSPTKVTNGDSTSNYNPYVEILSGGYDAPAGAELGDEYTIFTVATKLGSDNDGRIFDGHTGNYSWGFWGTYKKSLNTNGSPAKQNTAPAVNANNGEKLMQTFVRQSGGALDHRVDGVNIASYGSSADPTGVRVDINQGANAGSEESDCRVYEMIIYNSALTTDEIRRIESYLMTKFGMKDIADYRSSLGAETYSVSSHDNDIIGLGKECYFEQKQSESTDDSCKVWISTLAASNAANGGSVTNDISYLMLGHDDGALSETAAANLETPATINVRLEREWKLTNTNFSDDFSIEIEVDDFGPFVLAEYKLMVDSDGDFSDATLYGTADGLTFAHGSIIVSGIGTGMFGMGTTTFFTIGSSGIVLPVELISFQAVNRHDVVDVSWHTATQRNNDYFSVQRSISGEGDWIEIDRVHGESHSDDVLAYHTQDDHVCEKCYYRLVQVDFDGTETISEVVALSNEYITEMQVELYPNPADNLLSLDVASSSEGEYLLKVYSVDGVEMSQLDGMLNMGMNTISIHLEDLSSGLYYLEFTNRASGETTGRIFTKL